MAHRFSDAQGQLSRIKKRFHLKKYLKCVGAEDSKLRKVTYGEKDPLKPNKTILLVGETGAGKSTLIDVMLNHLKGTKYEDEWCTILEEDKERSQAESQTTAIILYELFGLDNGNFPYSLTIIDTPGFGDTKGNDHDAKVVKTLEGLFSKEIKEIDAVGLVVKEGTNRLTDRQSYIFDQVVSLFGKDIENNIIALITHSGGQSPKNVLQALEGAKIRIARDGKNKPIYFLFNNCQAAVKIGGEEEEEEEEEELAMKHAWETSERNMKKLFDFLTKVEPQDLKQTAEVLTKRIRLEAKGNAMKQRTNISILKEELMGKMEEDVKKWEQDADQAKMTTTYDEVYKELQTNDDWWDYKATRCTICEENCHFPGCTWAFNASWCEIMINGKCTICQCEASSHVRDNSSYVTKTRTVTKTVADLQKLFKINSKKGGTTELLAALKKGREDESKNTEKSVEEMYQCIIKLGEISLKKDTLSIYPNLDYVIERYKETGNDERVKEMTELKNRIEAEAPGALHYGFARPIKAKDQIKK